ncbi:hypothetical protein BSKO_02970 [Bryopsis sp. KO-2023]|nr:hypothetical protein BSKO_02970 [Bryopsis sp. KO-2023]
MRAIVTRAGLFGAGLRTQRAVSTMTSSSGRDLSLNRADFSEVLRVKAFRIPSRKCQLAVSTLGDDLLCRPKIRPVQKDASPETRLVLLKEDIVERADVCAPFREVAEREGYDIVDFEVPLDYSHFSADQVLKRLLPENVETPSSFELVGPIAHLNLRKEHEPFKNLIGEVILDKNPVVKTVVNKVGTIENEFRVFQMEVLAGEANFETEVREHGLRFKLDYSKVYWNSRLENEHQRLVSKFKPKEVICDMMGGIGPFAVPAGKKGCVVYANDLNPDSFRYLQQNITINKVGNQVQAFNLDAREFVRLLVGGSSESIDKLGLDGKVSTPVKFDHAIMNLPASAIQFLDVFNGLFDGGVWSGAMPWIHCYTFVKGDEPDVEIMEMCEKHLGGKLGEDVSIHRVRDVAPSKIMVCVSFRLLESVGLKRDIGECIMKSDGNVHSGVLHPRPDEVDTPTSPKRQKLV